MGVTSARFRGALSCEGSARLRWKPSHGDDFPAREAHRSSQCVGGLDHDWRGSDAHSSDWRLVENPVVAACHGRSVTGVQKRIVSRLEISARASRQLVRGRNSPRSPQTDRARSADKNCEDFSHGISRSGTALRGPLPELIPVCFTIHKAIKISRLHAPVASEFICRKSTDRGVC